MSGELVPTQKVALAATATTVNTMVEAEILTVEESQLAIQLEEELQANFLNESYTSNYGAITQAEVARFAREASGDTRIYELGPQTQQMLRDFKDKVNNYKKLDPTRTALGLPNLWAKIVGELRWWLTKYQKIKTYIDEAEQLFKKQINNLEVGMVVNNKALQVNKRSQRALIVHIIAGKQILKWAREVQLPELQAKAESSQSRSDFEAANDFAKQCDIFELKLNALDTSLMITYIRKPEIDMLRDSQRLAISTLNNLVTHAIPTWYEDMRLALGVRDLELANQNAQAGREIGEGLFMSNIDRVGDAAKATVKNAESGFIRTSVLIEGTDKLLAAISDVNAAFNEAITNVRQYEKDRAANNERIKALEVEGAAA